MGAALVLLFATILSLELIRPLRLFPAFTALGKLAAQSGRLIARRGVSEWAKERAMRLMSLKLFDQSLRAAWLLALIGAPLVVALLLVPAPRDSETRLVLLIATIGWSLARRRMRALPRID